ncbi:SRPBCC family protein [Nostoc sp. JL33]|uniref:SRPBCC family protein n=1 Tax=Nostoc sp. JL33 TaxID=2815396 RepID=UPI0025CE7116|nr:SRPBCC family protein [Nostoc sp. JL33]MBN3869013.1 SRPBCC family protein [Nostoc sp. JL33]
MTKKQNTTENLDFQSPTDDTNLEGDLSTHPLALLVKVEIEIEKIGQRHRQISAKVQIPHSVEQIWKVLTDYEALPDFLPNLAKSRLIEHPNGGIRLEQVGSQRLLNFNFSARVVLDLEEYFPKEINFKMVEGDFKGFSGSWCLEPYSLGEYLGTNLCYTIQVWPKLSMPVGIIENRLSKDLRLNLLAIHQRVEELARKEPNI